MVARPADGLCRRFGLGQRHLFNGVQVAKNRADAVEGAVGRHGIAEVAIKLFHGEQILDLQQIVLALRAKPSPVDLAKCDQVAAKAPIPASPPTMKMQSIMLFLGWCPP